MPGSAPPVPDPDSVAGAYQTVMGVYDSEEGVPTYVLADLSTEDRWLSVPAAGALSLEEWR